jgi:hypothetical protein
MSDTLRKLFNGVLTGQPVQFRILDEDVQEEVGLALRLIPMPLSRKQEEAIRNAWSSDLSYIQGPPGTGKSHTITALMLSALVLEKSVLLVSHKKAAIDVVRRKLHDMLGEEFAIYVGNDASERDRTKRRIGELIEQCGHGFAGRLSTLKTQEERSKVDLLNTLHRIQKEEKSLGLALARTNANYRAQEDHLRYRTAYARDFQEADLAHDILSTLPDVPADWAAALESLEDVQNQRFMGEDIPRKDLLRARLGLVRYRRKFNAEWIADEPWNAHRLRAHYASIVAYDLARQEQNQIHIQLNLVRRTIHDLEIKAGEQSRTYLRTLLRRIQLENAKAAGGDLKKFQSLFRLRRPSLIKPLMEQVNYAAITRIFPIWLGEMRNLGGVLPLQSAIFDMAVVDEASQVNIPEVVPAFYRAKSFVVVGDQKQLGLEAAGLFAINRTYEELTWNNCFGGVRGAINYAEAKQRKLNVSDSSILDFMVSPTTGLSIPQATLDEHYRSMPSLANYTSQQFYEDDGGLKVMTEVSTNLGKDSFRFFEVGGERAQDGKYVPKEVDKALELVRSILSGNELGNGSHLRKLGFEFPNRLPSVGIISFTTDQRNQLRVRAETEIDAAQRDGVDLFIGTPEEFQGNERDVMILTFGIGSNQRYARGFYEKPTRFNVATSRARKYTYAVLGACPPSALLLRRYFGSFGYAPKITEQVEGDIEPSPMERMGSRLTWTFDHRLCESEFERLLLHCLQEFIDVQSKHRLKLFNQVQTCGQKRLDFVIYDEDTTRSVAIEVDGPDHFVEDGRTYSSAHMERVSVLKRAGWNIVHVPYFQWYRNGWLYERNDPKFERLLEKFYVELMHHLGFIGYDPARSITLGLD